MPNKEKQLTIHNNEGSPPQRLSEASHSAGMRRENLEGLQTRERRRWQVFDRTIRFCEARWGKDVRCKPVFDLPRGIGHRISDDRLEKNSSEFLDCVPLGAAGGYRNSR